MSEQIKHIEVKFNAEWFESCYSVYVLTIKKGVEVFYYIGQTGDRKHISARSPFYRLMGHYSPYQGTDTQLVRGLIKNNLINIMEGKSLRVCLEEAFYNKHVEVKADYFKVDDFDGTKHSTKRILVEQVEQVIINYFLQNKKIVFNKIKYNNIERAKANTSAINIATKITNIISLQTNN